MDPWSYPAVSIIMESSKSLAAIDQIDSMIVYEDET